MTEIKTDLRTIPIIEGMEETAEEWMKILIQRRSECVETLEREKMHIESIFKTYRDGRLYLSWFTVRSSDGETAKTSEHEIDKIHQEYQKKCIDRTVKPEDMEHVVSFVPTQVEDAIQQRHRS